MSNPVNIEISISKPIVLELEVNPGYVVTPSYQIAPEPLFTGSEAFKFKPGDKAVLDEMNNLPNMVLLFENNLI